ncbi:hypothetical protein B0H66DRAFT_566675 [Apodospora peruviana]|uniref:Uncharacterized protein n=1 Tax=Apodospora peruviana TaxID=516989 RepID=A0AAE0HW36_9PEZI|nr:hypothetical protein B0H66DRAFT_566675 [Apodospora peruviana]
MRCDLNKVGLNRGPVFFLIWICHIAQAGIARNHARCSSVLHVCGLAFAESIILNLTFQGHRILTTWTHESSRMAVLC